MQALEQLDKANFEELTPDDWGEMLGVERETEDEILYTPPAVNNADSCNVLKFYQLNDEVLKSLFSFNLAMEKSALRQDGLPEFPFIPDDKEDRCACVFLYVGVSSFLSFLLIAEYESRLIRQNLGQTDQNCSILLCGRSGTGKTSIAVNRIWAFYKYYQSQAWQGEPRNQVFVTANRVLRNEVRKSFACMKRGFHGTRAADSDDDASEYPPTLREVPMDLFPLFLTQAEWLKMVDGTLLQPFWPRHHDGSLKHASIRAFHEEEGMLDVLPDDEFEMDEFESDQDDDDATAADDPDTQGPRKREKQTEADNRKEVDFTLFHREIYPKVTAKYSKGELKHVSAAALWTEINSYIKGSAEAVRSETGRLSRAEVCVHVCVRERVRACGK